jgi:hypothetical protein
MTMESNNVYIETFSTLTWSITPATLFFPPQLKENTRIAVYFLIEWHYFRANHSL